MWILSGHCVKNFEPLFKLGDHILSENNKQMVMFCQILLMELSYLLKCNTIDVQVVAGPGV